VMQWGGGAVVWVRVVRVGCGWRGKPRIINKIGLHGDDSVQRRFENTLIMHIISAAGAFSTSHCEMTTALSEQ